ncbi:dienelactone hydrolase family protein [Catenuloplanes atrovinosus]|uniref:Pimeloyl-ACP methyl ester carboxylesterase n=1 Tax=Catenuloplanes atrovinosus TaxID=137266 RepID=A0AAE3YI09_9ACTN|nr:dienelactone hydrolase family protein [Catenuloplanes atrovinosus]MDR7273800.1 pimeloyl-ACP methyl ester carboxylesterase [Catenuloplanes atrovinosus]
MGLHTLATGIDAAGVRLDADLVMPAEALGVVLFAHGSGSSRHSPRNTVVAEHLHRHRLGTILPDLLTRDETIEDEHTRRLRFDIGMLADRLIGVIDWIGAQDWRHGQPYQGNHEPNVPPVIGLFGASTGAAAALVAAAARRDAVRAVVSRGGRPDLAGPALVQVAAPTLLIVGEHDPDVMALNRDARAQLTTLSDLLMIPGAGHLFEEEGALEQVSAAAAAWFADHLRRA